MAHRELFDMNVSMPRLDRYDSNEGDGCVEHEALPPRVVGSSQRGLHTNDIHQHETSDSARSNPLEGRADGFPRSAPRTRRSLEVSGGASDAPTPRVSALLRSQNSVGRHGAQWRGAYEAVDTVHEPKQIQYPREESGERAQGLDNSRMNLGVGTRWRPTAPAGPSQSEMNLLMQALERVTEQLNQMRASTAPKEPEIEFAGKTTEDPEAFFRTLEDWLFEHRIPEARYPRVLRRCLKEEAYNWFTSIQD